MPSRPRNLKNSNILRLRRLFDSTSLEAAWTELTTSRDRATASTVEALMLGLRERGTEALTESAIQGRLSDLHEPQIHEVCERLQRLKSEIARAWMSDEITALLDTWNHCHG